MKDSNKYIFVFTGPESDSDALKFANCFTKLLNGDDIAPLDLKKTTVQVTKPIHTMLRVQDIEDVSVMNPEKHGDSNDPHVIYTVRTTHTGGSINVPRRYSEFSTFREKIASVVGATDILPALPERSIFSRFDPDFVAKRTKDLDRWLKTVLAIASRFSKTDAVVDFLSAVSLTPDNNYSDYLSFVGKAIQVQDN